MLPVLRPHVEASGAVSRLCAARHNLAEALDLRVVLRITGAIRGAGRQDEALAVDAITIVPVKVYAAVITVLRDRLRTTSDFGQPRNLPSQSDKSIACTRRIGERDVRCHTVCAGRRLDGYRIGKRTP